MPLLPAVPARSLYQPVRRAKQWQAHRDTARAKTMGFAPGLY
jgi:hypothetical protein